MQGAGGMAKWNKNDPKGTRWCAELDIHHFYESLRPDVALARQLRRYYRKIRRRQRIPISMAVGLLSRLGQLRHCNSVRLYKRLVKPGTQRALKCVVRDYMRKERTRWNTSTAQPGEAA